MAVSKVFVSYRREDTAWAARAVYESLRQAFARDVFIDIETISVGKKFAAVIDDHLEGCQVMLAMIGPAWEVALNKRLQSGALDHVRVEITRALAKDIPLVPVLVDRRDMPEPSALPEDLRPLLEYNGLVLEVSNFDDQMKRVIHAVKSELAERAGPEDPIPRTVHSPPVAIAPAVPDTPAREAWMSARDLDEFGDWAEFSIDGVVQRLRWIAAGEFWMGSTEAERKRFTAALPDNQKGYLDGEQPRHRVSLTQGFWLADTACTQALWQTVVGDNPSHYTGNGLLPVENVSWDDVTQRFLPALNHRLRGAIAQLPTEAEWEFACRAGSQTAFSWGESVGTAQVNFDGNHPCPGQAKGQYREKTLPAKSLQANAWGLYQMHGNVWEWCVDGKRPYAAAGLEAPAVDPQGPAGLGGAQRVIRGGSWDDVADWARSAYRHGDRPDYRGHDLGFRLALRSRSSSPVQAR